MKPACARCTAGAAVGIALALAACSDSNPVLPPGGPNVDASGGRGVQQVPDASTPDEWIAPDVPGNDAADVAIGKDAAGDRVLGIDAALPPIVTVTILSPAGVGLDGGAEDGGTAPAIISTGIRFAPKVSIAIETRGGDPTTEVLASVKASIIGGKPSTTVTSATLNQTQFNALPDTGIKSYLFSDTPLDVAKVPSGTYTFRVDATTTGGLSASASASVYVDGGPTIAFLQPTEGACVKGSIIVSAVVTDNQAGIASVTFTVGQVELPAGAVTSSGGLYTATIDFGSFDPPLDGVEAATVTAVNGNGNSAVAVRGFTVDNDGPVIEPVLPVAGKMIGKLTPLQAKVTDTKDGIKGAGVMESSVVAVIAHGDIHFEVSLSKGADGVYKQVFDTTQLPEYAIFPSISFRAQDILGNESSVGYLVSLDNTPPVLDLDPPATFRLVDSNDKCSWPFDPVGPDAVDDGSVVTQLFDIRARIQDLGNKPLTGTADFIPIYGIDPATVKVLIVDDSSLPVAVDTSDPPDGICDDVNPELTPSVSPQSSKEAQILDMVQMPANSGSGDFSLEPGSYCSGNEGSPKALCVTTYSQLKDKSMTYSLGYAQEGLPAIWTVGPLGGGLECGGRQFDASNNLHDGWACLVVEAADGLGNKQVSRPIRICVAAQKDSTACAPAALGGAELESVTLPNSQIGVATFVTTSPLVNAGGAAIQKDDQVVFSNVGPLAAASLNGTHTVSPSDSTGTSFTITDWYTPPAGLWIESDDGKSTEYKGPVEIVLKNGAPGHVTTTDATALDEGFAGHILLSVPGRTGTTRYVPTDIQKTGFDLAGTEVELSGGVIPISRMPNCTGTVIKQASGALPTVDATRPCIPWRSFPAFEFRRI